MSAVLHYFNGRGKAEIIRLVLAVTGVEWTQVYVSEKDQFQKLKDEGKLLFGQLPLVEFNGKRLIQSNSTVRFFARKGNLLGSNEDEITEYVNHFVRKRYNLTFHTFFFFFHKESTFCTKEQETLIALSFHMVS
jgi:hypothetical protein